MSSAKASPRISAVYFLPFGEGVELASISFDLDEVTLRDVLGAEPDTQLRALSHADVVLIGLAVGARPVQLGLCPGHSIVMRGPTVMLPLEPAREDGYGSLSDVKAFAEPPGNATLDVVEAACSAGEDGAELRKWSWGETFPSLNRRNRREQEQSTGGNFSSVPSLLHKVCSQLGLARSAGPKGNAFETYALSRRKRDDIPEDHNQILEIPAYVASKPGFFPFPASVLLSAMTFYIQELEVAVQSKALTETEAGERLSSVLRIKDKTADEHLALSRGKEWPLTVDSWLDESWDKEGEERHD